MNALQALALSGSREGGKVVIKVCGELDFATAPSMIEAARRAVNKSAAECIIDCEEVTFIDSETFKMLLAFQKELSLTGKSLYLRNCSRQMTRPLILLGLETTLEFSPRDDPKPSI